MMYYIPGAGYDAPLNLALEQYVFDRLDRGRSYMMLWQNANAVIVGKHQNTAAEINAPYVKAHDIQVVRRLSGGGAVYHDLGNVNFTFIADAAGQQFDFAFFCHPVVRALRSLGVNAEISGRNDMTIDGMKFSGNAQYIKQGRVMHHGTIMFDSDLNVLSQALRVSSDKIESKGLKSIHSRVTNVRPHLARDCGTEQFIAVLEAQLKEYFDVWTIPPETINIDDVRRIREEVYATWEWNYGYSPAYSITKKRRFDGVGEIEARMEISDGRIQHLAFFGDFFARKERAELIDLLIGVNLNETSLEEALLQVSVDDYFQNLGKKDFINLVVG
ncbi:MAG: lipoate--protein ligase [Treponema sp.]|jgi:lipoate-protein ligase A|nr:lipoate--protein ligase [Treponema sp.]